MFPVHKRGRSQIGKNGLGGEHGPDDINHEIRLRLEKRVHADAWIHDKGVPNLLLCLRRYGKGMGPEILEKFQILDVLWMIFIRGTHPVREPQSTCRLLARRSAPSSSWIRLISLR